MSSMLIYASFSKREEAEKIVEKLLEERLIACGSISGPIMSHFWWKIAMETAEEYIAMMKTGEELFDVVCKKIEDMHSYEVPEVVGVPIHRASHRYLEWLDAYLHKQALRR